MTSSVGMPWLQEHEQKLVAAGKPVSTADAQGYGPGGAEYWSEGDLDEFLAQETGEPMAQNPTPRQGYDWIPGVSRIPDVSVSDVGTAVQVASAGIDAYQKIKNAGTSSTATAGVGGVKAIDGSMTYRPYRKRRRRRRLLTAQDKADIAFLHGQLGSGQLGRAAISALLSRRVA